MDNTISALHANAALLSNAASNVANLNTTEYKSIQTTITQDKTDAVAFTTKRDQSPGSFDIEGQETSNVDVAKEFTDMMLAETGFSAALKAISKRENMLNDLMGLFTRN